jgi:acyl-CoA synthetase (AMP-forming)/AMP-acid ligase II/enoyl-CoA hydratase/carnithine racemase
MEGPPILVEHLTSDTSGVVKIILNRPKALNAINIGLLDDLVAALREHANARVILIEGAGDRSFCAGEDLKQTLAPKTGTAQELRVAFNKLQDITRLTSTSSAVVVAAVQGFAIGGGAEIALAADFVIGGPTAKFRFPEVPIGHAHTGGITLRLAHLVGLLRAKQLILTGRWVAADEALKLGLLTELADDPKGRAAELALQLASLPGISLASAKASMERSIFPNTEANLQDEVNVASYCFAQSDAAKAFTDFAARKNKSPEKRAAAIRDINTAFKSAVDRFPDHVFIRFAGKDITFGEVDVAVAKLAGGLQEVGIEEEDRVLVLMRNSVEMVYSWLAANRLGAMWVPVNVELKSLSLRHVVEAAQPKLALVDAEFLTEFRSLGLVSDHLTFIKGSIDGLSIQTNGDHIGSKQLSSLLESQAASVTSHVEVKPSTTAALLYTSGTTGKSKPCMLSHEYFILQARALIDNCGLRQDDVLYCPFPLFHADASALTTIPAILLGAIAALSVRFSASQFWDEIRATKATVYDFMGATLALSYKQPPTDRDREHHIRLAWGVPIPNFAPDYEKRFGHKLITLYGSVEASLPIFQEPGSVLPLGSCGKVRPGHQVRIADDAGEELPPNTQGNLLLRSDAPNAFFKGYFKNPESTAAAFAGLWFHTGDLAKVDEAGNVYFLGRSKDVIRRRGENVNASEVEDEFLQHPDVVVAAAYGIPSQLGPGTEDDIKLAVQMRSQRTVDERGLWEWSVKHMARFQVPSVIEIVEEIKRTPTGKLEKRGLTIEGGRRFDIRSLGVAST